MSLATYRAKRKFNETPEPRGGKPGGDKLVFVVQKHDASRLHYDLRLEWKGVLKSWAIPKGPTTDPSVKRLAMLTEDHPYDYKDFEGIIPEGNYGAGTMIVWDQGYYTPFDHETGEVKEQSKAQQERQMARDFENGQVKVFLHGKKLKGKFALINLNRGKDDDNRNWLLIKDRDNYAATADITVKDKSVLSGKTIAQMSRAPKTAAPRRKTVAKRTARKKTITR